MSTWLENLISIDLTKYTTWSIDHKIAKRRTRLLQNYFCYKGCPIYIQSLQQIPYFATYVSCYNKSQKCRKILFAVVFCLQVNRQNVGVAFALNIAAILLSAKIFNFSLVTSLTMTILLAVTNYLHPPPSFTAKKLFLSIDSTCYEQNYLFLPQINATSFIFVAKLCLISIYINPNMKKVLKHN